jgi:hypothetical protein
VYRPRIVGGKVIRPADLRRLHKGIIDMERINLILDDMRAVVESSGRNWHTSRRRGSRRTDARSNKTYLIALTAALSFAIVSSQLGNRPSPDNGTARASIVILSFLISEMSAHRHRGVKSP